MRQSAKRVTGKGGRKGIGNGFMPASLYPDRGWISKTTAAVIITIIIITPFNTLSNPFNEALLDSASSRIYIPLRVKALALRFKCHTPSVYMVPSPPFGFWFQFTV